MPELSGKVIWLTGASSGIGEALARRLGVTDCKLALSARRAEKLEELCKEINGAGGNARAYPADVTDKSRVKEIAEAIAKDFGGPVDILITNAGTYKPTDPLEFSAEEYDDIMKLNYSAALYCIEAVLPSMIERKSGHIVGVSSVVGYRGLPRACSYGASKAAMINFLESLRFDLKPYSIGVSIVNPGFVRTPLTDKNDFSMPFIIPAERAADIMVKGIRRQKKEIHFPWQFSWMLKFLRVIPFPIYEFLISRRTAR